MKVRAEVIIIGAGFAGLSAAIYLGRAQRDVLVLDAGKSMGRWEPKVQNFLGFPEGISGERLLEQARRQAHRARARFKRDNVTSASFKGGQFLLQSRSGSYACRRLLLATGIFHVPPDIPGVSACLGYSMFFCKDCDGVRVRRKRIAIYGWSNETAEYALAMLAYTHCVTIVTDGRAIGWDKQHADLLKRNNVEVQVKPIQRLARDGSKLKALLLDDGTKVDAQALFTTRGDIVYNDLARNLGAELDATGQIVTDLSMRTSVKGLYAAGCVTTANCQMIIAAGQGATAAQAINRELFEETWLRKPSRQSSSRPYLPVPSTNQQHTPLSPLSSGPV